MKSLLLSLAFVFIQLSVKSQTDISDSTSYFSNGKTKEIKTYCEGKLHGVSTEFYESGVVKSLKTYSNGVEVVHIYFYSNSIVQGVFEYTDGKISKHMKFNEKGILTYEEFYKDGVKTGKKYYIYQD